MDGQRWLRIVQSESQKEVAYVPFGDRTTDEYAQCMSDAKLYAAAPELVYALKLFVRAEKMARDGNPPQDADKLIEIGEAAIAEAGA